MSSTWLQQNSKFRGGKKANFGGMLRKYHISQLHVQNPVSSPRAEWGDSLAALAGAVLAGPQDCRSPYSHKDIQPQRIHIYILKHNLVATCEPRSQSTGENAVAV